LAVYIEFSGVSYSYKDDAGPALREINLSIDQGQFVTVIGANGSGKSTLARHINALLLPQSGLVTVGGMNTRDPLQLWHIRGSVAMVFQNPDNQLVAASVEEDIAFGPENLGVEPGEIRERVDQALEVVGLAQFRDRPPHLLSGGQKQRLAIAGALALKPVCLVLDEPTALLDPGGRKEVLSLLTGLNKEKGITIVLVTHHMEEVLYSDRALVMSGGRLVADTKPRTLFDELKNPESYGLGLTCPAELALRLKAAGLGLRTGICGSDELVAGLCQL